MVINERSKIMKRILTLALAILLIIITSSVAPAAQTFNMTLVSGGPGGTYFYMGSGITLIINEKVEGVTINNESTSATPIENLTFVHERNDTIGLGNLDGNYYAFRGDPARGFTEPLDKIRTIMVGHNQILQVVTLRGNGITDIGQLRGKSVGLPTAGNSAYFQALAVLEAYGLTQKDYKPVPSTPAEAGDALRDGTIDVMFQAGSFPHATIMDLDLTQDIYMLSISPEVEKAIHGKYPHWSFFDMIEGTYTKVNYPVRCIGFKATLMGNVDMDEDLVYRITKALVENNQMMTEIHAQGGEWSAERTRSDWENPYVPYHPGADKFFREIFK